MKRKIRILSSNICSVRIMDIPPLGAEETGQVIRHKLAAFYPGSADDLYIDYVRENDKAVVFFASKQKIDSLSDPEGNEFLFYSPWHFFASISEKDGYYGIILDGRIELFCYENDHFVESRSLDYSSEREASLKEEGIAFVEPSLSTLNKIEPLFRKKKKKKYFLSNLLILGLLLIIPQFLFYRQVKSDEEYNRTLKKEIQSLILDNARYSGSEEEYGKLMNEYQELKDSRPLNINRFLSELSSSLGRDVVIESLVLKGNSFQLNGVGLNPLGKMEKFQNNGHFSHVVPYQVKALENSSRETFSLTGVYHDE
ncbi:hypothetical protein [Spirochaeta isovalerica]|uniref:Uncharacterized protein n=1 Tax=Spirochaeta isovalerica TaxID=150 RepID=A0A841R5R1_9SPIO|nr:hypothetical protein [Spirochaeta isovalerica]MBB6478487.1 hypothetical protein [Spirochaeta isovalerica]